MLPIYSTPDLNIFSDMHMVDALVFLFLLFDYGAPESE